MTPEPTPTPTANPTPTEMLVHLVTLECRDADHAHHCLEALQAVGRPDALAYGCLSYDVGRAEGCDDTVVLVERWRRWEDLDALLVEKVVPALPRYNALLRRPFDPGRDTRRVRLVA
jgi:quinol monooxygenase YgiN